MARAAPRPAGHDAEQHGVALVRALEAGALESAERMVEQLLELPDGLERAGSSARVAALETLLMLGHRDRAFDLGARYAHGLARTAAGMSVLELLGVPGSTDFLPNGLPNLLRLSRRLATGQLDVEELVRLLGGEPSRWLRTPELHLLLFNALVGHDRAAAARFLDRFLRAHGAPRVTSLAAPDAGQLLGAIRFETRPTIRRGPLVSVLVAARNAATTIGYALDSLLGQSYERLEILVGDDASTDETLEILRRRLRTDVRLRVFRSTTNQGAYNVRNALAQHARGEILAFHDADDLALPQRVACQVRRLRLPGIVACVANWARVRPEGAFVFHRDQKATRLSLVSLMLTRAAFNEVGPFRAARVGADLELYTKLVSHYGPSRLSRIKSPLILGLWSPSSATRAPGTESLEDGYRSPARRRYSELIASHRGADAPPPADDIIRMALVTTGNFAESAELVELS